ncbi:MAG: hypothetical protein A3F67_00685 [Verrucomicrobia bacterium RIFCSPHIGHO2_12_FULL_41_10]|nr:MAG: hypothetical protein A3F67_00685 [Verrucomicrobia bacterium RIFCSPHIGHO2_12_FULL_41_10]HLB33880.1 hypothetical protein [Chthoniobacterales bacterium]
MSDYNRCIGVGTGLNFIKYLDFIKEAKNETLSNRVTDTNIQKIKTQLTQEKARLWADFLSSHILQFDFSKKLDTSEGKKRFIAKNYGNITDNDGISFELKYCFDNSNWEKLPLYTTKNK